MIRIPPTPNQQEQLRKGKRECGIARAEKSKKRSDYVFASRPKGKEEGKRRGAENSERRREKVFEKKFEPAWPRRHDSAADFRDLTSAHSAYSAFYFFLSCKRC